MKSAVPWFLAVLAALAAGCTDEGAAAPGDASTSSTPDTSDPKDVPTAATDALSDVSVPADVPDAGADVSMDAAMDATTVPEDAPTADAVPDASDGAADAAAIPDVGPPPVPCVSAAACDDGDACTVDDCNNGVCAHEPRTCDDSDPCTAPSCDPTSGCAFQVPESSPACCYEQVLMEVDFEDASTGGLFVADLAKNTDPPVLWQPDGQRAHSGSISLYFGLPEEHTYDNGMLVAASATTAPMMLPAGHRVSLTFWAYLSVETGKTWDVLSVSVVRSSGTVPVWAKGYETPLEEWTPVSLDLSAFAGEKVQVAFVFNSNDTTYNDGEGVYIDDIHLLSLCAPLECTADADCDDGVPCTDEACAAGTCTWTLSDNCCLTETDCYDGDACTIDVCDVVFGCSHTPLSNPLCCNTSTDCDDKIACTDDLCTGNECKHVVSATPGCCGKVTDCDDGDKCTIDKCDAYQCFNINTCCKDDAECDDGDDVCTIDACTEGACTFTPTGVDGCCPPVAASFDFDGGDPGWEMNNSAGAEQGFQIWAGAPLTKSAPGVLYYGDPVASNFDFGTTEGTALSPPITLQAYSEVSASFWVYMDTEGGDYFDVLSLELVNANEKAFPLWKKGYNLTTMSWHQVVVNLTAFQGQTVRLRFTFYTNDSYGNGGLGVLVDDLQVTSPCVPKSCAVDKDCDDGLPASTEQCMAGFCNYTLP